MTSSTRIYPAISAELDKIGLEYVHQGIDRHPRSEEETGQFCSALRACGGGGRQVLRGMRREGLTHGA